MFGVNDGISRTESAVIGIDCCSKVGSMLRCSSGGIKTLVRMLFQWLAMWRFLNNRRCILFFVFDSCPFSFFKFCNSYSSSPLPCSLASSFKPGSVTKIKRSRNLWTPLCLHPHSHCQPKSPLLSAKQETLLQTDNV